MRRITPDLRIRTIGRGTEAHVAGSQHDEVKMIHEQCKKSTPAVYIITIGRDVRECQREGDFYVHVLNSAWRIGIDDNRIQKIS